MAVSMKLMSWPPEWPAMSGIARRIRLSSSERGGSEAEAVVTEGLSAMTRGAQDSAVNEVAQGVAARVDQVLKAMGSQPSAEAAIAIARWISTVRAWNKKIDLTAARSDDELVDLMLADAVVIAPTIPRSAKVVDVGTGAGAPGLAIALLRDDVAMTLVEPLQKRVALLRTTAFELTGRPGAAVRGGSDAASGGDSASGGRAANGGDVERVRVIRDRGEDVARRGERFDVAISRATLAPPAWLRLGADLAPSGDVWVLLARDEPPALPGLRVVDDLRYRWPLTGAERRAVRFAPEP